MPGAFLILSCANPFELGESAKLLNENFYAVALVQSSSKARTSSLAICGAVLDSMM